MASSSVSQDVVDSTSMWEEQEPSKSQNCCIDGSNLCDLYVPWAQEMMEDMVEERLERSPG